ncbi:MAG TPA: GNAT family N-acetyltransferase [Alphaproteobacteria bacterium]|nr:GNAT family N-acetyltransferase [Alphaproteobacteria bacterium]
MNCQIKRLQEQDWASWKEIRLESVKLHPEFFGGSYAEESVWEDEEFKKSLIKNDIFGAFVENQLIGVAGFFQFTFQKLKHRGTLFGLYVRKENRGQGAADQLIEAVINHARQRVLQLHCTATTGNKAAINLYQRYGFQIYGTEPRSLKVGENFYDEHLMVLKLD